MAPLNEEPKQPLKLSEKSEVPEVAHASQSFLNRHTNGSIIVSAALGDNDREGVAADGYRRICGCWWSGNMRVLLVTAMLFLTITIAQTVAADIARSEALLADCGSMAVDALTYFLNIFVECLEGRRGHRAAQLIVPAISIGLLTVLTAMVLQESISTLQTGMDPWATGGEDDGDFNPWIMLAFALWGFVFDIISMIVFLRNEQTSGSSMGVNMMTAFLHVGADFLRAFVTFIAAILIISFGFNGTVTDAWACFLCSCSILVGAAYAIYEWIVDACCTPAASAGSSEEPEPETA